MKEKDNDEYFQHIREDFNQLKTQYPFSTFCIFPTVIPSTVEVDVIAASREFIEEMNAKESDFTGEYDRSLKVVVPFDYRVKGCNVYGGAWLDTSKIKQSDRHFYIDKKKDGMPLLCVGVPDSFTDMHNVLLENVRTATEMLNAYELLLCGITHKLILKAYEHGDKGKKQYETERSKYRPNR